MSPFRTFWKHARDIHRIFRGPKLRRITQLGGRKIVHRASELDCRGDNIDPLFNALAIHGLSSQYAAWSGKQQLEMNLLRRAVPGVVTWMEIPISGIHWSHNLRKFFEHRHGEAAAHALLIIFSPMKLPPTTTAVEAC